MGGERFDAAEVGGQRPAGGCLRASSSSSTPSRCGGAHEAAAAALIPRFILVAVIWCGRAVPLPGPANPDLSALFLSCR